MTSLETPATPPGIPSDETRIYRLALQLDGKVASVSDALRQIATGTNPDTFSGRLEEVKTGGNGLAESEHQSNSTV